MAKGCFEGVKSSDCAWICQHLSYLDSGGEHVDAEVVALRNDVVERLVVITRNAAAICCEIIRGELPRLRAMITSDLERPTDKWDQIVHTVLVGLLLDLGVRECLLANAKEAAGEGCWVFAFEGGTRACSPCGVQAWKGSAGQTLARLWHYDTTRPSPFGLDPGDVRLLSEIHHAGSELWHPPSHENAIRLLKLAHYRLIARTKGRYRLAIPAFGRGDRDVVRPYICEIARNLTISAVLPAIEEAESLAGASSAGETQLAVFRHACARLVLEHSVDSLIRADILPCFPRTADHAWGAWLLTNWEI